MLGYNFYDALTKSKVTAYFLVQVLILCTLKSPGHAVYKLQRQVKSSAHTGNQFGSGPLHSLQSQQEEETQPLCEPADTRVRVSTPSVD